MQELHECFLGIFVFLNKSNVFQFACEFPLSSCSCPHSATALHLAELVQTVKAMLVPHFGQNGTPSVNINKEHKQ